MKHVKASSCREVPIVGSMIDDQRIDDVPTAERDQLISKIRYAVTEKNYSHTGCFTLCATRGTKTNNQVHLPGVTMQLLRGHHILLSFR